MSAKRIGLLMLMFWSTSCAVVQRIDTAIDCGGICGRYASCFDSKYDTGACETRCRKAGSEDPDYRRKADMCNACITERSCASAGFACATECLAVVP
jgi:hypothetical protein